MPRVMVVLSNLGGGGAERMALLLMGELANRGHAVTLFAFRTGGALWNQVPANVRVRTIVDATSTAWPHAREIWSALADEARDHDVVIGALEGWPTLFAYAAAKRAHKPCIGWVHADYRGDLAFQCRFLWITRLLDRVVCVSAAAAAAIRGRQPHIIYNAVPTVSVEPRPANAVPIVLAIGRLSRVKRFEMLIEAHALLHARGLAHTLEIVGEGPARAALQRLCAAFGVAVEMPGFVADLAPWYRHADVVVSCSRSEGFSLVVAEALARGIPVIATRYPAARELLVDGRYGELVDESVEALADGIARLLADRERRDQLHQLGPERAADFNIGSFTSRWEQVIVEVL